MNTEQGRIQDFGKGGHSIRYCMQEAHLCKALKGIFLNSFSPNYTKYSLYQVWCKATFLGVNPSKESYRLENLKVSGQVKSNRLFILNTRQPDTSCWDTG